jgi:hypothetical protein
MTITPAHKPAGTPDGGQFTSHGHSDSVPSLASDPAPVVFQGHAQLNPAGYATLPELPASVGTPEVSFSFSDAGKLETHVTIDGSTLTFWTDDMDDEVTNAIENGNSEFDEAPWSNIASMEDFQAARTWGESVHERVESATTQIAESAVESEQARASIIAFATGRQADGPAETPAESAYRRAEAALAASTDSGEDADTAVADLFTDLRLYADKHGVDFHEALERSYRYYLEEKQDPSFQEG